MAANQLVWNAASPQFLFEDACLIAGAHEDHGLVGEHFPLTDSALNLADHSTGFIILVLGLHDYRGRP